ncbi:hypothetical protein AC579_2763 [Pseudocercospora musae]|uniref:DUF747-domain-containing protein n=1 Tax=Pseudocercospora musae TaxID=113226 RepID=A0A139IHZ9_9PEZI|nr:hypothetical protein AC579_2763 [Pseudocercospora musae]
MSYSPTSPADGERRPSGTNKHQLPTPSPTLSPISEHGHRNTREPFPEVFDALDGQQEVRRLESKSSRERRKSSEARTLKLSPSQIRHLTTSPDSLPLRSLDEPLPALDDQDADDEWHDANDVGWSSQPHKLLPPNGLPSIAATPGGHHRPAIHARATTPPPPVHRKQSSSKASRSKPALTPLRTDEASNKHNAAIKPSPSYGREPSPMPSVLPIPPPSLPTYLQLELSSDRPSALYIHRSAANDVPYESSAVKFERLKNFLLLPFHLEHILMFGTLACLDAWLYTFTILPLRFLKAVAIFAQWFGRNATREAADLGSFVYNGLGRLWHRRQYQQPPAPASIPTSYPSSRRTSASEGEQPRRRATESASATSEKGIGYVVPPSPARKQRKPSSAFRHRRVRSTPSVLLPNHKADLLQGLLIAAACVVLTSFDASRMYHSIRGQSAMKLYVIYNVLEVFDRLLSALGQDILECLFSKETLERDTDGRSKVKRPLGMFLLAIVYTIGHSTVLFYQVVTLNVAVNSYSNALLTLLMSNQFVEIKSAVFKKFEKENLFQMTCADVVERFQLLLMLLIIALRNVVEVGGLSISLTSAFADTTTPIESMGGNSTSVPLVSGFVIPKAFTLLPKWTGQVLGPFLIVLGSEALVDWCKHAYITKFNNVKPNIYGRFLDVMAKDYYSHAFADQNLTKRLGLPVIPLSCLFIRAVVQTYHMFLAIHMPAPIPSAATSISVDSDAASSSATMAAFAHFDQVLRRALGRSSFGAGNDSIGSFGWWTFDDFIALATMLIFFLASYLILLAFKLLLGMGLLSYARNIYKTMKEREKQCVDTQGRRVGGWGTVEVNEDKRRWIYEDDPDTLNNLREKESRGRQKADKGEMKLDNVDRYTMVAKRIW